MAETGTCVVGVRAPSGALVKAFDVRISGEDAYVNYSDSSVAAAHGSYHASGQQHVKIDREYVNWSGGSSGEMEPMKIYREPPATVFGRNNFWSIGWKISTLETILRLLDNADVIVDASTMDADLVVAFEVSVIGPDAKDRVTTAGFPIVATHVFGGSLKVEIAAFTLTETQWEPATEK